MQCQMQCQEKTFLQSWNWGEFEEAMGDRVWRLGVYNGNYGLGIRNYELMAVAQVVKIKARRGSFLLVPHGPVIAQTPKLKVLEVLMKELKQIARQENCAFIRIAPIWGRSEENEKIFKNLGFKQAPIHIHPELTWELDLTKNEEEILAGMRKTTRYLIKQGLKDGYLEILKSRNIKDVEVFNKIYQETVQRHRFVPFSLKYLKNEFLAFTRDPSAPPQDDNGRSDAVIFLAKYQNEYLASAIVIFWQGIAFYHQGASITSKIPAAYLLQWEAIKEAKARGCKIYNFWGIADVNSEKELEKHPWKGLSLFKKGFGGYEKAYVKTQDYPVSWRYWLTRAFEEFRNNKRGF